MRVRVLMVVGLVFAAMLTVVGGVTAQTTTDVPELKKLILSVGEANISGDLVTFNEPNANNPFGGPSQLTAEQNAQVAITQSSHFVINPGHPYGHFNPAGQNIGLSHETEGGAVETELIMPVFDQNWTPVLLPGGAQTPEDFFEQFVGDVGPGFGPQFGQGEAFEVNGATVVPPAGGSLPDFSQPFEVRIQGLTNEFGPGWCSGSIFEFFTGDAMPGDPTWVPADFAPNDSFAGLSQAHVTRCVNGEILPTQLLVNNGSGFQPQPTHAMAIFMPNVFVQIIPFSDVMGSEGCRQGAFVTDASNPFQPENSVFTTAPPYPTLNPMNFDTAFINNPWPGANLNPLGLTFGDGSGGSPGFQDNYGMAINPKEEYLEFGEFAALMIQFGTYQIMEGTLVLDPEAETYSGMLEGEGEGYKESIIFNGDGSAVYTHDTGTPETYEVSMEIGNDMALVSEMLTVYEERETAAAPETTATSQPAPATSQPAPTTITSPGDDPGTEGGSDDSSSGSPLLIIILVLLALIAVASFLWWLFFGKKKVDPCKELYDAWQKAKAACDEATKTAKQKRTDADKAETDRDSAEKARKDHCKAYPPACGPQSSATDVDSGRTVTRDDLHVQRQWTQSAWSAHGAGTQSAAETEAQWKSPPTKEFREKALADLEKAKAKTPELDKAINDAKTAEATANAAADQAEKDAKKACDSAAASKKAYDECVMKRDGAPATAGAAAADSAAGAAAGGAVGGVGGAVAGGAAAVAKGAGGKDCSAEQQAYDGAKKACDDATKTADKADEALSDAEQALEDLCEEYPPLCRDDWAEESGKPETRVTTKDLFLQDVWAEQVWLDYQNGDISAQEASDRWSQNPPEDFAKDELQKVVDAKPLKDAREQAVKEAKAKADQARPAADAACAKADAAMKALNACKATVGG
jgi:hypothetical protein